MLVNRRAGSTRYPVPVTDPDTTPSPPPPRAAEVIRRLGPAGPLALVALILPIAGSVALFLTAHITGPWLREHGVSGVLIYAGGFALLAGLALLPTYAQAVLGGYVFAFSLGTPAALGGFLGGSIIGYEIGRLASGQRVIGLIEENAKLRAVRDALVGPEGGHGFWRTLGAVSLLRLPPNSPFALTNLVMASIHVPRAPFLIGTLLGMAPRTAAAVSIGAGLQHFTSEDVKTATPTWLFVAGIISLVVVVMVIGMIANRAISRAAQRPAA